MKIGTLVIVCLLLGLSQPLAAAGVSTISASSVNLGTVPRGVAVNPESGTIYALLYLNGTTLALNPQTLKTVAKIPTPSPYAVAIDSTTDMVYVSQGQGPSISVISGSSNSVTGSVEGAGTPYALAVDEEHDLIFGADPSSSSLWIINGTTDTASTHLHILGTSALTVDPSTHEAFVGNLSSSLANGTISALDGATGSVLGALKVPFPPAHLAVDPASHLLFVTGSGSPTNFMAINDTNMQVDYSMYLAGGPNLVAAGPSGTVFVSAEGSNALYQINATSGQVLLNSTGVPAAGITFTGITGMAYGTKTGDLYITENDVANLIVLDLSSATTTSTTATTSTGGGSASSSNLNYIYAGVLAAIVIAASAVALRKRSR